MHQESLLIDAYKAIMHHWIATNVITPNWHVLDNEVPKELKQASHENNCTIEHTPPDMHWQNIAEQAIQTIKNSVI